MGFMKLWVTEQTHCKFCLAPTFYVSISSHGAALGSCSHTLAPFFTHKVAPGVAVSNEAVIAFIKGKSHSTTRMAGGTPSLQFKDNGTSYGKRGQRR